MTEIGKVKSVTARIGTEPYRTELITDTHITISDEPADAGGRDLGPSPGDLLRMSLASCTAITLRMYANRKAFDVKAIEVKVNTEELNGKTLFHCSVYVDGSIGEHQRKRMLQIAKACPIHKVLTNPIEVLTKIH